MTILKFSRIGAAHGVVLPDEILKAAGATLGDEVAITVTADGVIQLAVQDRAVLAQVDAARDIARRFANALRELAK